MEEFVKNIMLLLGTIGYPILQKFEEKTVVDTENPLFLIQNKDGTAKGTARMTNEALDKGSIINSKRHRRLPSGMRGLSQSSPLKISSRNAEMGMSSYATTVLRLRVRPVTSFSATPRMDG